MEDYSSSGNNYSIGEGAFISGEGKNFTIFFNTIGTSYGIDTREALLLSGTKATGGIKNLRYAFVMVEKGDDPEGILMKEGVFRVFQDKDGMSYSDTWPISETRVGEWLPENCNFMDDKTRVVK